MRTPALAGLLLLPLLGGCVKDDSGNSVWLAVTNDTGRALNEFTVEHGRGRFQYALFSPGLTHGGWARVKGGRPVTLTYLGGGERRSVDSGVELGPELTGGRVLLSLQPDGSVRATREPRLGPPPTLMRRLGAYQLELSGLAALLLLPALIALARRARAAAAEAGRRARELLSDPLRDAVVARLGLSWKTCPVPMYTLDPDRPFSWHEGSLDGLMLGLHEGGRLWVGAPDTATIVVFERGADGGFRGRDFTERQDNPLLRDAALGEELARLSPAMLTVGVLGAAVEGAFDWKRATADQLVSDARVLRAVRARVEAYDPPLVRAVLAGDEGRVRALLAGGADLEAETIGRLSPVVAAAALGRADLLRVLLAAGARAQPASGWPLFEAAGRGHLEAVKALVEAGASAGQAGPWGGTALHEAATKGHAEVVAYLLEKGCDPAVRNKDGATALGYARYGKHQRVIELLTAAGAR